MWKIFYPIGALDRPLGLLKVEAPRISGQSARDGGKVVSALGTGRLNLQETSLVLTSARGPHD